MKEIFRKLLVDAHRHRRIQFLLTMGTVGSVALYYMWPERGDLVIACNVCTNAIWIWGE